MVANSTCAFLPPELPSLVYLEELLGSHPRAGSVGPYSPYANVIIIHLKGRVTEERREVSSTCLVSPSKGLERPGLAQTEAWSQELRTGLPVAQGLESSSAFTGALGVNRIASVRNVVVVAGGFNFAVPPCWPHPSTFSRWEILEVRLKFRPL